MTARMYRWSVDRPDHRRRYNIVMMAISITVALVVGTVGLSGVLVDVVGWQPARVIADTDLDTFGFVIVAALVVAWGISGLLSRRGCLSTS